MSDDAIDKRERRITYCTWCNLRIIFLETVNGLQMPTDADTVGADDDLFDPSRHSSHFKTCLRMP